MNSISYIVLFNIEMKNKNVGWLVIGISLFVFAIIVIFNYGVTSVINATCSHGPTCSMYRTLSIQTWISLAIASIILVIGLFLVFAKENERIIVKKIHTQSKISQKKFDKSILNNLEPEERKLISLLMNNKGSMFQSELVKEAGMNKVRVTRLLDALEAQGLVDRRRRGMTNVVMLKTE